VDACSVPALIANTAIEIQMIVTQTYNDSYSMKLTRAQEKIDSFIMSNGLPPLKLVVVGIQSRDDRLKKRDKVSEN
jgi:hypothetical protein